MTGKYLKVNSLFEITGPQLVSKLVDPNWYLICVLSAMDIRRRC